MITKGYCACSIGFVAKLTYVDAASFDWIGRRKIKTVWSTDRHLGLTGAEILPRS